MRRFVKTKSVTEYILAGGVREASMTLSSAKLRTGNVNNEIRCIIRRLPLEMSNGAYFACATGFKRECPLGQ